MAERRREVRGPQPQKLLSHIEAIAMLGRKAAGRGDAFDVGQQHAACGERKEIVELQQAERRQLQAPAILREFFR